MHPIRTYYSDAHMAMAGPLMVGLGVVFAASLGQLFLPASPLLYNVVVYGGLTVFGGFTYMDTQVLQLFSRPSLPWLELSSSRVHLCMCPCSSASCEIFPEPPSTTWSFTAA